MFLIDLVMLFSLFIFFNLLIKTGLTKNAILVALYIVGAFILSGFLYLLGGFAPLGVILILVYVGAVVVLFLFVIMIIPLRIVFYDNNFFIHFFNFLLWFILLINFFSNYTHYDYFFSFFINQMGLFYLLGMMIYLDKMWYFLLAAFLLTISMIGAISITQTKITNVGFKEIINIQLNKNYKADFNLYN